MNNKFGKYILQFSKDTGNLQTHLSFNKGKYNVPDAKFEEFYEKYYEAMQTREDLYIIEKIHKAKFAFFLDIDVPKKSNMRLNDSDVLQIVDVTKQVITDMYGVEGVTGAVVSKRTLNESVSKYHVNFYNLVVDANIAKTICDEVISKSGNPENKHFIDTSVYKTGLRMLGSKKNEKKKTGEMEVYSLYNLEKNEVQGNITYDDFKRTIIRVVNGTELTELKEEYKQLVKIEKKPLNLRAVDDENINRDISKLLLDIRATTSELSDFDMTVEKFFKKANRMGLFCYYVTVKERKCPFKHREHARSSNPLYVEISQSCIYVKCHDQDCLRRKFPDNGIELPKNFESEYKRLHESITTKYWSTEVNLTAEIKRCLEDSLIGSHYQIAKAAFMIFKDKFRVDDVKNTTWYEFDGVRWNKSHLINILMSEELPKYYRGIKISDTSVANKELEDFLGNEQVVDANLRNQLVDNIISKLENVNFKANIINQIMYLFKTHDPDFYTNLDSSPYLVGFKNGVYDFRNNTFRSSVQTDYITFSTGYEFMEYDETNENVQEIYDFLGKIIPNTRVREYLLKVLGKALVGIPEEKFYIWTGISGANGKSTLVNFLEHTLGDYTTSVDVSLLTNKRATSSSASPDVVRLRGKRIFTFQEPEHDDKLRTGILKQFTGGDTIIARELFKAPITFKLQGTMLMCCNDLPAVSSIDGGTWRRIRVIEFKSRFCDNPEKENEFKIDPSIKYKIKEWRPYFMSILIHWYNRYLYEGMCEPSEVKKATDKYKVDNDKFNEFFSQCLEEVDDGGLETNKTIYNSFQNWWSSNYPSTRIPDNRELKRAMKIKYGNEKEETINNVIKYGFSVRIKDENGFMPDDDY
jgi:P4 family phage/plasmid primase-like protien